MRHAPLFLVVVLLGLASPAPADREGGDPPKPIYFDHELDTSFAALTDPSLAISSTGVHFAAFGEEPGFSDDHRILIYRSDDRGRTWTLWDTLGGDGEDFLEPRLMIAEGQVLEFVYVAYLNDTSAAGDFEVARAVASAATPNWVTYEPASQPVRITDWCFDVRSNVGGSPAIALAYLQQDQLWNPTDFRWNYTASLDAGLTWSPVTEVRVTTGTPSDGEWEMDIAMALGSANNVHLAVAEAIVGSTSSDTSTLVLYTAGNSGTGAWPVLPQGIQSGSLPGGNLDMDAQPNGDDLVVAADDGLWVSEDGGVSWSTPILNGFLGAEPPRVTWTSTGPVIAGDSVHLVPSAGLTSPWDERVWSSAVGNRDDGASLAEDPTTPGQFAMVGISGADRGWRVSFGAQWRTGPGYGLNEDYNPYFTGVERFESAPAVVDLDGDGNKEIVLTGTNSGGESQLMVYQPREDLGSAVITPTSLTSAASAPAIFDVDADGDLEIFVGSASGGVEAFDHTATPLPGTGWPVAFDQSGDTWVSIGPVSGWAVAEIVAANANRIHLLSAFGVEKTGFPWMPPSGQVVGRAAIGDVDGDGDTELVAAFTTGIAIVNGDGTTQQFLPVAVAPATGVSLADLDADGDLEIAVPRTDGRVDLWHHTGSAIDPAWPFDTGSGLAVSAISIANLANSSSPALCFTSGDQTFALNPDATALPGYPYSLAAPGVHEPILGRLGDPGSDRSHIVSCDEELLFHITDATGESVQDWPKFMKGDQDMVTPALGDLDDDGIQELVLIVEDYMHVLDMGTAPLAGPARRWPMAGHDPARSGCADCLPGTPTAVEPIPFESRVSFAGAAPNPLSARGALRFALPRAADVDLSLFDLRGRRVRTLLDGRQEAGEHAVLWDLRDNAGTPVAAGTYFGRLVVGDVARREVLVRRVTVVR